MMVAVQKKKIADDSYTTEIMIARPGIRSGNTFTKQ